MRRLSLVNLTRWKATGTLTQRARPLSRSTILHRWAIIWAKNMERIGDAHTWIRLPLPLNQRHWNHKTPIWCKDSEAPLESPHKWHRSLTHRHSKSLLKSLGIHAREHYPNCSYGVYPIENDSAIAILLVANRYSPSNFWYFPRPYRSSLHTTHHWHLIQEWPIPSYLPSPCHLFLLYLHRWQDPSRRTLLWRWQRGPQHNQANQPFRSLHLCRVYHLAYCDGWARLSGRIEPGVCSYVWGSVQESSTATTHHSTEGRVGEGRRVPIGTRYFRRQGSLEHKRIEWHPT